MRQLAINLNPTQMDFDALQTLPHVSVDEGENLLLLYQTKAMVGGAPAVILIGHLAEDPAKYVIMRLSVKLLLTLAAGVQGKAQHDGLMGYVPIRPDDLKDM